MGAFRERVVRNQSSLLIFDWSILNAINFHLRFEDAHVLSLLSSLLRLSLMAVLSFELSPESCAKLHDLLTCLAKFNETISLEAQRETVCIADI